MIVFVCTFLAIYCLFLVILLVGWQRLKGSRDTKTEKIATRLKISVIIPVRNEEKNISSILDDCAAQSYRNFEIIIVDDHSSDQTAQKVKARADIRLKFIANQGSGKKDAIRTAIELAEGDVILTTDADCRMSPGWIGCMASTFENPVVMMAVGPVKISENGFFAKLQQIEFASVVGTSAIAIHHKKPLTANGANLAYRKQTFFEVGGFEGNKHIPSGDDEFLLHKISNGNPTAIAVVTDARALVTTLPLPNLKAFLSQRIRWASKWRMNRSLMSRVIALLILFFQAAFLVATVRCVLGDNKLLPLVFAKVLLESLLLIAFCRYLKIRWNWLAFTLLQFAYPLYVIIVGVVAQLGSFTWKGRVYR